MTEQEIRHITLILAIKGAFIFYIFVVMFRLWTQNRALKKIETILQEGEKIIYQIEFQKLLNIVFPLLTGGIIGGYIFPLFLYPENQQINEIAREHPIFLIAGAILAVSVVLIFSCKRNVLTNRRILNQWSFDFMNVLGTDPTSESAMFKNTNLFYSNILSINLRKFLWITLIDINTKDNKYLYLRGLKNLKKILSIIENQINKGE